MIAAQQYYIEHNSDLNAERLLNLLPNYIPDYCLTNAEKSIERWNTLIVQAYKKVRGVFWSHEITVTEIGRIGFMIFFNWWETAEKVVVFQV